MSWPKLGKGKSEKSEDALSLSSYCVQWFLLKILQFSRNGEKRKFRKGRLNDSKNGTFLVNEEASQVSMLNSPLPPDKLNSEFCFTVVERVSIIC